MKQNDLKEGIHFYTDQDGYIVLTEKYLLEKGFCCGMGCFHCPYNYGNAPELIRSSLIRQKDSQADNGRPG